MLTREEQEAIFDLATQMRDREEDRARKYMAGRITDRAYFRGRAADEDELREMLKEVG